MNTQAKGRYNKQLCACVNYHSIPRGRNRKSSSILAALIVFLLFSFRLSAATITSVGTGNWDASAWPNTVRTGTITTSTASTTITGIGTSFTTELSVGNILKTTGNVTIGTVASITSNTSLLIVANAASNNTGIAYNFQGVGPADAVIIAAGHTVTINVASAVCAGLTLGNGATASVLTHTGTNMLTINGPVTMFQPTASVANLWNINSGIANVNGLITFAGSNTTASRRASIVLTTGTLNANAGITFVASVAGGKVINMAGGAATLNLKGALTVPAASSTLTAGASSIFNYCDNIPQTINFFSAGAYTNLYLNNTDPTNGVTLGAAVTALNVTLDISVNSGLFRTNNLAMAMAAARTLTVANGAIMNAGTSVISPGTTANIILNGTFQTANTVGFSGSPTAAINSTNNPTITLGASSTIEYNNGAATQTVTNRTYAGNVILTGLSKTIAAGALTIAKNLTINSGATYNGTTNNPTFNLGGNFSNSGTFNQGTGLVTFNGTSPQTILGLTSTTFAGSVTLNNTSGLLISTSPTITGTLTFTNGLITTGSNKLILGSAATTAGAGAGKYVYGNLEIFIPNAAAPSRTLDIGDASSYTPVTITFAGTTTGSGSLIANSNAGDHSDINNSGIDATQSVNRNWTITAGAIAPAGFTSYAATFTFVASDVDAGANTANFIVRKKLSGIWVATTVGTRTATTTQASGMVTFGEYQLGISGGITVATNPPAAIACQGTSVSFSSTSTSLPAPTIAWQRDPNTGTFATITAGMDGGVYSNFTTTTLNISNITGLNNYKYRAVFTNINGTATSTSVALISSIPSAAGTILGSATACTFQNGVAYSVPLISGASSYVWSYSGSGFTIASGVGTNSITADFSAFATPGNLTVYASNGCGNGATSPVFPISVSAGVGAAGAIVGTDFVCTKEFYTYSIPAIPGATSYQWTYTGLGVSFSGNSNVVTASFSALASSGNLTVRGLNGCGLGSASAAYAITTTTCLPHNTCASCHMLHSSPGGALTAVNGNPNLCISCHNPAGTASTKAFSNADKAVPGVSGNSHAWSKPSVNSTYQTNLTTSPALLAKLSGDSIICSTCHEQHYPNTYTKFLRISNAEGELCLSCHNARDIKRYADNPANKGSHPVGIAYAPGSDIRFNSSISFPLTTSNKVSCSSCHSTHFAASNNGTLLRTATTEATCTTCHTYVSPVGTINHKGMSCTTCHYAHNSNSNNIYLLNDSINTPNSGKKKVVFTSAANGSSFADGTGTMDGVCEVCHTNTDHFTNVGIGTTDARHFVSPTVTCVTCHPHDKGFAAQANCFDCHNAIADKPSIPGTRRQIVDNTGNGLGTGGDFKRTSHHVTGGIPNVTDCIKCHYMGDHKMGTVKLLDPDLGFQNIISYDPANKSSIESFCLKCHDANGSNGDLTPFSDNVTVPIVDQTLWNNSAHKGNVNTSTCLSCHDNGHGSNKSTMLAPYTYAGPGTGTDLMNEEEGFCISCHGGAGVATLKVHLAFSSYTNTATNFYKHEPNSTYRLHKPGETLGTAFGGANRHIECVDCHNPHGAIAGTATAPALLPTLTGARGVEPIYGVSNTSPGAPTGFTWQNSVTQEYQVCFKCHSSYTTLPTYLPGGINNQVVVADGLKKLTTGGTNTQIADSRDMAQEYNPNNLSFHPVMAVGKNTGIKAGAFQTGYAATSRIYCSSCHNSNTSATAGYGRGPHGSANLHILDRGFAGTAQYNTVHGSAGDNVNSVCSKCHTAPSDASGAAANSRFFRHAYHASPTGTGRAECYVCHDTHGSEQYHLMNFNRNVTNCLTAVNPNSQGAFNHAAGTATNSCVITCHGTGHNTTNNNYTPNY